MKYNFIFPCNELTPMDFMNESKVCHQELVEEDYFPLLGVEDMKLKQPNAWVKCQMKILGSTSFTLF